MVGLLFGTWHATCPQSLFCKLLLTAHMTLLQFYWVSHRRKMCIHKLPTQNFLALVHVNCTE